MMNNALLHLSLVSSVGAMSIGASRALQTCLSRETIAAWPALPINEPCYVGGGSDESVCRGYPSCCVTRGTCATLISPSMIPRGAGVMTNADYYDGRCWSADSSTGTTAPGCQGKAGECNFEAIAAASIASSSYPDTRPAGAAEGLMSPVPQARLDSISSNEPCIHWDVIQVEVTLTNDRSDFCSSYGRCPGGAHDQVCQRIGEAAGLTGDALTWVECTTVAGSTIMTATIDLPYEGSGMTAVPAETAMANLRTNIGTTAAATSFLSNNAHLAGYGGGPFTATAAQAPVMTQTHHIESECTWPVGDTCLDETNLIIVVVCTVVGGLLLCLICCFVLKKFMAPKAAAGKGSATSGSV